MLALIEQHRQEIAELCRRYQVERLDVFGSAVKDTFNIQSSDLDFIVQFQSPGERGYALRYLAFAESLEALFQRPVDVLINQPFDNPYFKQSVEQTRRTIYESGMQETVI